MNNGKMNNETCRAHSGIDRAIIELDRRVDVELKAMDKAVSLARKALDERLGGMNEFREQLNRQAKNFVTREAIDGPLGLIERVNSLERARANLEGRMWVGVVIIIVIQFLLRYIK